MNFNFIFQLSLSTGAGFLITLELIWPGLIIPVQMHVFFRYNDIGTYIGTYMINRVNSSFVDNIVHRSLKQFTG